MSEPGLGEPVPLMSLARVTAADYGEVYVVTLRPNNPADLSTLRELVTADRVRHYLGLWLDAGVTASADAPAGCLGFVLGVDSRAVAAADVRGALDHFPVAPEALVPATR